MPSKNLSVPMRVLTEFDVVISRGILVVIFILPGFNDERACADLFTWVLFAIFRFAISNLK